MFHILHDPVSIAHIMLLLHGFVSIVSATGDKSGQSVHSRHIATIGMCGYRGHLQDQEYVKDDSRA